MKNVIVLTHGWTGSSVFTALIGRAGAWAGDETHSKIDYNTYENVELIELNQRMMTELGYHEKRYHEFSHQMVLDMAARADTIDLSPYRAFVEKCTQQQPWIWKDPQLTWTIRVWARLMDLSQISFVVLTRDSEQAWISANLRRHVQTRKFSRTYNGSIVASLTDFLDSNACDYATYEFEDLQLTPEETVRSLNQFLGASLTLADVEAVYHQPLYRKSKNFKDKLMAYAIYFKNMSEARRA